MSLYLETEGTVDLPFDAEETAALVTDAALEYIGCPYEAEVDLLLTHDEEIREMNREHRNIDRPTDVLSFPMLEYETPGDFSGFEDMPDYFDPESGELLLGDIVISLDRVKAQAEEYGHSLRRELYYLTVHGMCHLLGYDHENARDEEQMTALQREILQKAGVTR